VSPTKVAFGQYSVCALLSDGTAACWGANDNGQLGDGTLATSATPVPVTGLTGATDISVGYYSACAVITGGEVQCWGNNVVGQLGNGTLKTSLVPVTVEGLGGLALVGASQVSVGSFAACAVAPRGALCWGQGPLGSGQGPAFISVGADPVLGIDGGVTAVAVGSMSACAIVSGGVQCWGMNSSGQLGNGGEVAVFSPMPVAGFP
jgi:alpha-tubulin suppressor-like RCC1 family protein